MRAMHCYLLLFSLVHVLSHAIPLPALPALPEPDPAPVQLLPSFGPGIAGTPPATIPAFPEQSDDASSTCPLDLSVDLLPSVSAACSSPSSSSSSSSHPKGGAPRLSSRSRCCPALAAWLYAAYSATALAAHPLSSASALAARGYDLPALPDDSESCAAGVERALRVRGMTLPRVNGTCDATYCYCGVRLRRLTCAGGAFVVDAGQGRWMPDGDVGQQLEKDCARTGLAGCTRCLRTLNQLKAKEKEGTEGNASDTKDATGAHDRECQLMGVTWLLAKNRTLYLPAATSVLRVLMAADANKSPDPTSCSRIQNGMPLAVGSSQINDADGSSVFRTLSSSLLCLSSLALLVFSILW